MTVVCCGSTLRVKRALSLSYGHYFAEFLNEGSLVHLGTFMPTHLCWFAVRILYAITLRGFSRHFRFPNCQPSMANSRRELEFRQRICLLAFLLPRDDNSRKSLRMRKCVPPSNTYRSAGILTSCPSTTPFGLALGPTNPGSSYVAQETLGLRCGGFSPPFLLLMPTFSLLIRPPALTGLASTK
jgi:hypothetical protein